MPSMIELTKPVTGTTIFINLDKVDCIADTSFVEGSGSRLYFHYSKDGEDYSQFIDVAETSDEIRDILLDDLEDYDECDSDECKDEDLESKFHSEE